LKQDSHFLQNVKLTGRDVMADGRVKVSILKEQSEKPGYSATNGRVQRLVLLICYCRSRLHHDQTKHVSQGGGQQGK
jgi:hypothetical protein